MKIRKVETKDFDVVYAFINELEETRFDLSPFKTAFESNIKRPDFIYLVAEIDHKIVAYLSCHSQLLLHHGGHRIAEIQEMYVVPEKRSIGLGKTILNELIQLLKEMGIEQLEVTSNNKRLKTHLFYEREGFLQTHQKFVLKI